MFNYPGRLILCSAVLLASCHQTPEKNYDTWTVYNGSKEGLKYSSLNQVDTSNVQLLKPVWEYHAGDADTISSSQIQCNPIVVNGVLYAVSPQLKLLALDAATGKEKWVFNPYKDADASSVHALRGVSYWEEGEDKRVFFTAGPHLFAINANTGAPINAFADSGRLPLHSDLGEAARDLFVVTTSPGMIYKDMIIIGSRVSEEADAAPGHIRSYDVRSGKLRWIFHTIPQPGEEGFSDWKDPEAYKFIGGANAWSGFSLDEERGILFAPTGSASFDFYGGKRKGANLYADCLLALDANTGKRLWHFQDIHHNIWDRDLPAPPALVTVKHDGKKIDAVAQVTKAGFVFLLDRETGKPLFPVEERPVPDTGLLPGEEAWPTQPFPVKPAPFTRHHMTEKDFNYLLPDSSLAEVRNRWSTLRKGHIFMPPSREGTLVFPGFDGGAEWGGPAVDPTTGILYINANEMPWVLTMVDAKEKPSGKKETNLAAGKRLYHQNCMTCHGPERQGGGNYPSLINIKDKYTVPQFVDLVNNGRRMMPGFKHLPAEEKEAIASYLLEVKSQQGLVYNGPQQPADTSRDLPYSSTGYNKFLTKDKLPAISPPWGTLNAINLNTGEFVWRDTLGVDPHFADRGIKTGTENYGAPVVTAGGLLFIAATRDAKIRAFHKATGKLLWEAQLPAAGYATPAVYSVNGKQYLVIACGGGKLGTKSGDSYIAFALP
ncbi:PQQ-binding-like beta-propeller repeat protein [Chitinophaga horti]|uniref:PQQ-binding-like beta-propeller repeat protein n=1 Tax=Chitinophaga horti TaxID=2920382 RepID=A0ABY6J310_9BACT|nr:PQQ-binding-like beta-propeller repeat protein [Chitinophaga horti]UYQ94032.1 PQQ-binding-like beta-propeller repeat protein [Chitinophaga horti]